MFKCKDCGDLDCDYDDDIAGPPRNCGDCGAKPEEQHDPNCDVQRCSACSGQRLMDGCEDHDPELTKWTGYWPGVREAAELKVCLNCLQTKLRKEGKPFPLR